MGGNLSFNHPKKFYHFCTFTDETSDDASTVDETHFDEKCTLFVSWLK